MERQQQEAHRLMILHLDQLDAATDRALLAASTPEEKAEILEFREQAHEAREQLESAGLSPEEQ